MGIWGSIIYEVPSVAVIYLPVLYLQFFLLTNPRYSQWLDIILPENAAELCSGRVSVSVTSVHSSFPPFKASRSATPTPLKSTRSHARGPAHALPRLTGVRRRRRSGGLWGTLGRSGT